MSAKRRDPSVPPPNHPPPTPLHNGLNKFPEVRFKFPFILIDESTLAFSSPILGGTQILVQRSSVARASIGSSGKRIFAQRKHVLEIKSITYLSGVSSLISSGIRSILGFHFCFDQLLSQ